MGQEAPRALGTGKTVTRPKHSFHPPIYSHLPFSNFSSSSLVVSSFCLYFLRWVLKNVRSWVQMLRRWFGLGHQWKLSPWSVLFLRRGPRIEGPSVSEQWSNLGLTRFGFVDWSLCYYYYVTWLDWSTVLSLCVTICYYYFPLKRYVHLPLSVERLRSIDFVFRPYKYICIWVCCEYCVFSS